MKDLPNSCLCLICHSVTIDPQQVICCGKVYCKECLDRQRSYNSFCPNCRQCSGSFPDKRAMREINSLSVYCHSRITGCLWKGELCDIEKHDTICEYKQVQCQDCKKQMKRSELANHQQKKCSERIYQCPLCKKEERYSCKEDHIDVCPEVTVDCPNDGCDDTVKRCELAAHRGVCPQEVVTCTYHNIGCSERMKRKDIAEHEDRSMRDHLNMAVTRIVEGRVIISPCVQKMNNFLKETNTPWYSPGFYTSPGGYKMSLCVYPNGNGTGKGTHLSCFTCLMPGEYNDTLEWPFRGKVTVELLNQLEDANHYEKTIIYSKNVPTSSSQVPDGESYSMGLGQPQFISHAILTANHQYLINGTLYFRVTVVTESKTKPWLTNFGGPGNLQMIHSQYST